MKKVDGWYWPDGEQHMLSWMANPKNRRVIHGRSAYQGKKQEAVHKLCSSLNRMGVAVDIGAHIGLWSFNLAQWFKTVEAFEPVVTHRECFTNNVLATLTNVQLHEVALGAQERNVKIRVNPESTGDSWVNGVGDIPMRTLDSYSLVDVDLIKIDAEGYEEFICQGAEKTIERCCPTIIVEQKRDMAAKFGLLPQGAVTWLKQRGYAVHSEIGGDYLMVHK